ncbi:ferredoxin, 2Fe-2S [Variovorax sp. HW608]|uniref:2Fe-2S iron-sulfur cluster-binding protein n=1 Tax=Variovorax sp. HW608 TaxID=1034889 RepID=UPI00081F9019|nr:2Fe-2S iron-sulfur cluster-binding protein [Variovorax sp. HW608]SCK14826.1 ferredoxin, 2Fe-2S [Variovorax sp. HW608]
MTRIVFVQLDGSRHECDVRDGTSIMQTAVNAGLDGIIAECGGSAMCATCHVYVDPLRLDALPPPDAVEDEMLDSTFEARRSNSRLACQLVVRPEMDGLMISLPQRQA